MSGYLSKPLLGVQIDRAHPLKPDVCYLLNEGAGGKTWDAARGIQSSAAVGAPVYSGQGMRFVAASTQYIPVTPMVPGAGDFTVCLRFRSSTAAAGPPTFYAEGGATADGRFVIDCSNSGVVRFFTQNDAATLVISQSAGVVFNNGLWHHVAAIRSGSTQYLYMNGVLRDSDAITGTITPTQGVLGAMYSSGAYSRPYDGDLEFLMLYRRALTPSEVASHAAQPFQMFPMWSAASRIVAMAAGGPSGNHIHLPLLGVGG
jgi:hypothetical protein